MLLLPREQSVLGHRLKVLGPLLLEKVALHDVGHILCSHHVSVVVNMTVWAIEVAHVDLGHKETASRALLGGVVFIHSHHHIAQGVGLNKVDIY